MNLELLLVRPSAETPTPISVYEYLFGLIAYAPPRR